MIAFLHTSDIHITKFENLVKKYNSKVGIKHYVNAEMLSKALLTAEIDSKTFGKEVEKIQIENPALIVCTCSTYGEECDKLEVIERIDMPIAKHLVSNFKKIGVAYTAKSTKDSSENLLERMASEMEADIELVDCNCSDSWIHYENNDFDSYARSIAKTIKSFENEVDVIFLAQASMEGAKDHLQNFKVAVLSSPEFGVREYVKML
jgi:hypothetical protein